MPSRAAVSRSMLTYAESPSFCRSELTLVQFGILAQPGDQLVRPSLDGGGVGALQGELILGLARGGVDGQVLHRLQIQVCAGYAARPAPSGAE